MDMSELLKTSDPRKALMEDHLRQYGVKSLKALKQTLADNTKENEEKIELHDRNLLQYRMGLIKNPENAVCKIDVRNTETLLVALRSYVAENELTMTAIDELLAKEETNVTTKDRKGK